MGVLLILIGGMVGAMTENLGGVILGAVAGFLLGDRVKVRQRLSALEQAHRELAQRSASAEPVTTTPVEDLDKTGAGMAYEPLAPTAMASDFPAAVNAESLPETTVPVDTAGLLDDAGGIKSATRGEEKSGLYTRPDTNRAEPAIVRTIRSYFTGGNLVVRVGIIILFFGVAFLLKYAAEHTQLPIEARLAGVALGAVVLLVLGWRLREKKRAYALALQGGAVGVLYLTVFAALRLYQLLPPQGAFALLLAMGVFTAILAIRQDALVLAMLGTAGGFLAPVLSSSGTGNHIVLFSYFAVLNAGIFGIAWFKAWRLLNLLGFVFTFVIGALWGTLHYRPELFASSEPFLILFFLFFVAIAVLYAHRQAPQLRHYVDGTLIFGTPVIAFGLQAGLVVCPSVQWFTSPR